MVRKSLKAKIKSEGMLFHDEKVGYKVGRPGIRRRPDGNSSLTLAK